MHSVSVIGDLTNGFRPVTDVKLRMCVNNVLMKCNELNIEKYDEDDYRPIQTVMFPVFATGNGGKDFSEAARLMVERTLEFFYYHPHTLIQTVYFVAFNQEKLDKLLTILNSTPDLLPPIRE
jgi:O-acetyl-ADP-ribose deacetylase (regulator of RNase III)